MVIPSLSDLPRHASALAPAVCGLLLLCSIAGRGRAAAPAPIVLNAGSAAIVDLKNLSPSTGASLEHIGGGEDIGGWSDLTALVYWTASVPQAGIYQVTLNYAVEAGNAGSTIAVHLGDRTLTATLAATRGWQDYTILPLGDIRIDRPGDITVSVNATARPHDYVMNLRSITLTRSPRKRETASLQPSPLTPLTIAGKRVLWLGDSITQDGTYVTDVLYSLDRRYPGQAFDFVSIGLASETSSGLSEKRHPFPRPDIHERLQRALDRVKPAVVVACYGMNDGIYHPQSPERMKAFQKGITSLIATVRATGARMILLTPPPFDPKAAGNLGKPNAADFSFMDPYPDYDSVLSDYARWETSLRAPGVDVIDLHTPLADSLAKERQADPTYRTTADGIHPGPAGHLRMAHLLLNAMGVPVDPTPTRAALDSELATMTADPLYALVRQQRQARSDGWLTYVGYIRDKTVAPGSIPIEPVETAAQTLQAQIDTQRQPIRVACIGDSITFGAGISDRNTQSYPAVLGHWLGEKYQVQNFGVSGTTLLKKGDYPYWRQPAFDNALRSAPNIVVIMLGTNDTKSQNWKFKDEFTADYTDMVRQFAALPSKPTIYLCRPVPVAKTGNFGINEPGIVQEIPMIDAIAAAEKVSEIDLHAALNGRDDLLPDNVHPNAEGARLMAAAVYRALTGHDPAE